MAIKKSDRQKVFDKYNGHCAYCGKDLKDMKNMQVDHIISKRNGGPDDITNYNPACRRCNHYKRGGGTEYLRTMLFTIHERLRKNYLFKVALDYGIVEVKPFDGVFYFEKVKIDVSTGPKDQDVFTKVAERLANECCPSEFGLVDILRVDDENRPSTCVYSNDQSLSNCIVCHVRAIKNAMNLEVSHEV